MWGFYADLIQLKDKRPKQNINGPRFPEDCFFKREKADTKVLHFWKNVNEDGTRRGQS